MPRPGHPGSDSAWRVRAHLWLGGPDPAGPRGSGRGHPGPRAGHGRDPGGRCLAARPHGPGDRGRWLDRLGALPADSAGGAAPAGDDRPRRGQPVRDRARADLGTSLHRLRVDPRRLQGARPHARGDAALPAGRRLPRRRLQARFPHRGQPAGGVAQQRDRHACGRDRVGGGWRSPVRPGLDGQGREPGDRAGGVEGDGGVDRRGVGPSLSGHRCSAACGSGTCSGRAAASCRCSAARSSRAAR